MSDKRTEERNTSIMKILLIIDSLISGGAQRQIVVLAKMLQEREFQIKVIYYHPIYFYRSYLDEHHISNEYVAGSESKIKRIYLIARAIRRFKPKVVISYLDTPNMITCLLKALGMKFRLITSERNTSQSLNRVERLKFLFLKKSDVIVSNSFSQEQFIKTHYPSLSNKVHIITNFVDLDIFQPAIKEKKKGPIKIIGAGRIEWQKNIGCLVKATKLVMDKGYEIRVDWYGRKTDIIGEYLRLVDQLELRSVFSFHEPTTAIQEKYQAADLFCLPSFYEGYPNVLCEAMACGLPVICSDVCDNAKIMEDGVNGYLFNPDHPHELASQIIKFATNTTHAKELMGKKSRELAEKRFDKEDFVNKYLKLIYS